MKHTTEPRASACAGRPEHGHPIVAFNRCWTQSMALSLLMQTKWNKESLICSHDRDCVSITNLSCSLPTSPEARNLMRHVAVRVVSISSDIHEEKSGSS